MRGYPGGIFGISNLVWERGTITRDSPDDIIGMTQVPGGTVVRHYSSKDRGEGRIGKNRFFRAENNGWITVAEIRI